MQFVTPKIILLGETVVHDDAVVNMIDMLEGDGIEWMLGKKTHEKATSSNAELLSEVAGRLCYKSFEIGMNPNVSRIRDDSHKYIGNIIAQAHGSVFEHSWVTLAFLDVSRVFTHELVRHGEGTAFSQESLRFVRATELRGYFPEVFEMYASYLPGEGPDVGGYSVGERAEQIMQDAFDNALAAYQALGDLYNIDSSELPFSVKKKLTSAMRRVLPMGMATHIIMSANHRALRHIIAVRTAPGAEEELRSVFMTLGHALKDAFPAIYQDMHLAEDESGGEEYWKFDHPKI